MALTATIYNFDVDLVDADRSVYEALALRIARHPSESEEYLVTRLLAYCLEYAEGIAFSNGLSDPDEPAISIRDLTGAIRVWIEIGSPDAARLHKAGKAAGRVVVYTHRDPGQWLRQLESAKIHRAADIEIYGFERSLISALAARLERRMAMTVSIAERHLLIATHRGTVEGGATRHRLA